MTGRICLKSLLRSTVWALVLCGVLCVDDDAAAQGTRADYERAQSLAGKVRGKVRGERITPSWSPDGRFVWFRDETDRKAGPRWMVIDTQTGERSAAFDHDDVAHQIARLAGTQFAADRIASERIVIDDEGRVSMLLEVAGTVQLVRITRQGDVSLHDAAEARAFTLEARPPGRGLRSGNRSDREVHVTFVNETDKDVAMHWVDAQGNRRQYATIRPGNSHRQHTFAGHAWIAIAADGTELAGFVAENHGGYAIIDGPAQGNRPGRSQTSGNNQRPRQPGRNTSPDRRWQVFVRDHNVFAREKETKTETQLTTFGSADNAFGGRVYWSPDSRYCVVMQTKPGEDRRVHLIESSPDEQLQPLLHDFHYRKPGDRMPVARPWLFDLEAMSAIEIDDTLFSNPWSINRIHWAADSSRFFFLYNQRGHQVLRLMAVEAATGSAHALITERSDTFINYSNKTFIHHLEDTDELIWMSERSGWNHLYLVDRATGDTRPITRGDWLVRGVDHVDDAARQIRFRLMGVDSDQDPYHVHFARIDLDGSNFTRLTEGDGTHTIEFSPDGRFYVDRYSRVDLPPVHELRQTSDGSLVAEMSRADWSDLLATGWRAPERFVAKGRDGATDIWGFILRPTSFDPAKTYPVIESIYAGPHGAHVPKAFRSYYGDQALAELGFIVVKIDGMGTNWRSKAFHNMCWKNIADAGFKDRTLWIKAAAEHEPSMDVSRVGIYGGSAGGQNAMRALLDHHDLYDVAVADCGCHDNRMDKIWWNEAWMGWPVDASYAASSNVDDAHKLQGKLLLTVGEMDRNVDPASTMQVVDALIKADKDFDLIVFPGGGHGAGGSRYGTRRMRDFFVRHLHGVEPRRE